MILPLDHVFMLHPTSLPPLTPFMFLNLADDVARGAGMQVDLLEKAHLMHQSDSSFLGGTQRDCGAVSFLCGRG